MENTIKRSWKDVTIDEYFQLKGKLDNPDLNDYEKEVIKLAFVNNKTEDDIWDLNINQFRNLQVEALWMDEFNISEDIKFNNLEISGEKYTIDTNLQNFTVAQYLDFQTFFPQRNSNPKVLGNILACFIIPKGKKYASGYDISKLVSSINSNLSILTANEIMFFFLKQYLISIRALANYFNWMIKRLKKKAKNKKEILELEKNWEKVKETTLDGLRSLIMLDN